ncbi:MAG: helix-turn-helix domain-containing protein [Ruminococcaceae bacterium]|nr:helix-turn-helix domain-containing protein [Oscillospiraceae bacterium]
MNIEKLLSEDYLLRVICVGQGRTHGTLDSYILKNTRNYCRFFYIISGKMRFVTPGGADLTAQTGDIVYLPNGCEYRGHWFDEGAYTALHFTLTDADGKGVLLSEDICLAYHDDGTVLGIFLALYEAWKIGEPGWELRLKSGFYDIARAILQKAQISDEKTEQSAIHRAILTMEGGFTEDSPDIRTSELARQCAMCESEFRRRFKEETGMPPQRYKNWLRVKKARELMEAGAGVSRAAETVGINDLAYFNKLFHQFFGCSPRDATKKSAL